MAPRRFIILVIMVLFVSTSPVSALAGGWFSKQSPWEKSGLDLQQGYDQNTVISLSGTVARLDLGGETGPALAVIKTDLETVTLVLGPRDFWQEKGIPLSTGDSVYVRGSKAQGRDGVVYLMVESIKKTGDVSEVSLRDRIGRPVWSSGTRFQHQGSTPMRQMRSGRNN